SSLPVLPVLVLACDRSTVRRCLDALLRYRPSAERFPVLVSQDCAHAETAAVIASYGDAVTRLRPPPPSSAEPLAVPNEHRKFVGYYKIARHYRWALAHVFRVLRHRAAIVVEDDLEVAPDFFEYFQAVFPLLLSDPSLWCASAWHDNGKEQLVDVGKPELLYRTDFFPGLGWLLTAELWDELEAKWPPAFWDDWMRQPEQRRGRSCVRPEISRTVTFGRRGVSHGQFFEQHLRFIRLNRRFVPFTRMDLSYLRRERYDPSFMAEVYGARAVRLEELQADDGDGTENGGRDAGPLRLQYGGREAFKALAKAVGLMDDLKAGVPRAGYRGVVTFVHRGRRVYLAPPAGWAGYDPSWG
ncbi:alpha-1,3-mannosyl-glycoprotein 2-beta-N-acetylglucosaminyltransferase, partial [Numida meleagris]|uniref:alpha-1,3-mannosyl-glycoprotein 2-beta-N-acetylglucosaminyltransferase n=1 Tax=Numida meleagris TaxID=8996 RepID=UPI000B3E1D34